MLLDDNYKNRSVVTVIYNVNDKEVSTETMDPQICLADAKSKIREAIDLIVEGCSSLFCIDVSYKDVNKGLVAEVSFTTCGIDYKIQFFIDKVRHVTPKLILSDVKTLYGKKES